MTEKLTSLPGEANRSAPSAYYPRKTKAVNFLLPFRPSPTNREALLGRFDARRPTAGASWYKAHGLGNDYLVVEQGGDWAVSPEGVRLVTDRTRGVGSDGVVVLLDGGPPFRLRMFNPDGGEFERSGNGLRILATYLYRAGRVDAHAAFAAEVGGDPVRLEVHGPPGKGLFDVSAEMGRASVAPADVGLDEGALDDRGRLDVPGTGPLALQVVSVGNPHAVVFGEPTLEALARIGPKLATHAAFSAGTNVQIARPIPGERAVEALVWERGVGRTSASGTSACAVAAASVHSGRVTPGEVEVRMEGGSLRVYVGERLGLTLRGPVQEVATGVLTPGFLESL